MSEAKYVVNVCCGSKCKRKGSIDLSKIMRDRLGFPEGKTIRDDLQVELVIADCMQNCGEGPIITVNGIEHTEVSAADAKQICDRIISGGY